MVLSLTVTESLPEKLSSESLEYSMCTPVMLFGFCERTALQMHC